MKVLGSKATGREAMRAGSSEEHACAETASPVPAPVETSSYSANHLPARYLIFTLGVLVNSFGIALITKGALGTSPISSLPYVLSLNYPFLTFGTATFAVNTLFIVLQIALLRRDFQPVQLLQLLVNVVFSWFIDVSTSLLGFFESAGLVGGLACVAAGCAVLGFGISVEVAPEALLVPGEGAVRAIATCLKARFGTVKICFDLSLVAIALVLSFVFFGEVRGLGLGTVVSALAVGKVVNLCNAHLPFLERIRELAR